MSPDVDNTPNELGAGEPNEYAFAVDTSQISIPNDQFVFAEDVNEIPYQSIEYLFIHELGHIFHNRINDIMGGELTGEVELEINGETRIVNVLDTPEVVREYLEAVGGYYTEGRDFDYPLEEYGDYRIALTNRNGSILFSYEADGVHFTAEQKTTFANIPVTVYTSADGIEFVYVDNQGIPSANEGDAIYFIEAGTYFPNFGDLDNNTIITYLPNEGRDTSEPKEGFADSFAAYILNPNVLSGDARGEFFDDNMQQWLCNLLREAF